MGRIWKGLIILAGAALFISILLFFLIKFTPQPPSAKCNRPEKPCRLLQETKLTHIQKNNTGMQGPVIIQLLKPGKKENARFLYFRDYEKVVKLARLAAKKAS